jgi:hypothetical protein
MIERITLVPVKECIRCGGCCKSAPCVYGRVRHKIAAGESRPDLRLRANNTYSCILIEQSPSVMAEFVGMGCHWPEYRLVKPELGK